jgi:hypothetical protein
VNTGGASNEPFDENHATSPDIHFIYFLSLPSLPRHFRAGLVGIFACSPVLLSQLLAPASSAFRFSPNLWHPISRFLSYNSVITRLYPTYAYPTLDMLGSMVIFFTECMKAIWPIYFWVFPKTWHWAILHEYRLSIMIRLHSQEYLRLHVSYLHTRRPAPSLSQGDVVVVVLRERGGEWVTPASLSADWLWLTDWLCLSICLLYCPHSSSCGDGRPVQVGADCLSRSPARARIINTAKKAATYAHANVEMRNMTNGETGFVTNFNERLQYMSSNFSRKHQQVA